MSTTVHPGPDAGPDEIVEPAPAHAVHHTSTGLSNE